MFLMYAVFFNDLQSQSPCINCFGISRALTTQFPRTLGGFQPKRSRLYQSPTLQTGIVTYIDHHWPHDPAMVTIPVPCMVWEWSFLFGFDRECLGVFGFQRPCRSCWYIFMIRSKLARHTTITKSLAMFGTVCKVGVMILCLRIFPC